MAELPNLHSACHLMLIDFCIKFREFSSYRADTICDRQTDGQTDRRPRKNNMSLDPEGGRHNHCYNLKVKVKYV